MSSRFRPYRRLRNDLLTLGLALAVPVLLGWVFPLEALRSQPAAACPRKAGGFAFVTLSPRQERVVLASSRAAWLNDRGKARQARIDLFAEEIPAAPKRSVLGGDFRFAIDRCARVPYAPDLMPPTLAAAAPVPIAPQSGAAPLGPVFSRGELLQLDEPKGNVL